MIKSISIFVVGVLSLASASILVKFCTDVPSVMIATYRLVLSSIFLIFLFKLKGIRLSHVGKKELLLSILSGVVLAIHFFILVCFTEAYISCQ